MVGFLVSLLINAVALAAGALLIPGFQIGGPEASLVDKLIILAPIALIFGLVNAIIRPIVLLITCLVNVITLGLFTLVINAAMLAVTAWISGLFGIPFYLGEGFSGFLTAFFGALVISVVSTILTLLFRRDD